MTIRTATDVINISAPSWDPYDSYGIIAGALAEQFEARGVLVNALQRNGVRKHATQSALVQAITAQPVVPALGGLLLGYPTEYASRFPLTRQGPRVALTMFESTRLPNGWSEALNQCDAVIVPSQWQVSVFRANGVTAPVHVVPLGLNARYTYTPRVNDGLTCLAFADRGMRKGWVQAVQAFVRAFGDREDVRLIVKLRDGEQKFTITNPNVEILAADLTTEEMAALYQRCDVMLFPTSGEGFGLPPREFAATGGLALATRWGGTADDLDLWGVPVDLFDMVPAWRGHPRLAGLGEWASVDVDGLATLLRTVAGMPAASRDVMGWRCALAARRLYDWRRTADRVLDIWNEVSHA